MIAGVALLISAFVMLGMGEVFRRSGQEMVMLVLRLCAALDALLGLVFLLIALRKYGEPRKG